MSTLEVPIELLGPDANLRARRLFLADWIASHPERHDQTWWMSDPRFDDADDGILALTDLRENSCGTTGCVAGWTVIMFGDPSWMIDGQCVVMMGRMRRTIDNVADGLLGLNRMEADYLFSGIRTRDEVLAALRA